MTMTAYGDESVRRKGVARPVYLLGVYLQDAVDGELMTELSAFDRHGKLHWRDAKPRDKRAISEVVARHTGGHLIVAAAPLAGGFREERARQQALATLLVLLERDYDVSHLVLERRERNQDDKDRAVLSALVRSGALSSGMTMDHAYGDQDPCLWVPDQVLGAYGDALAGDGRSWEYLRDRVRVFDIELSR